MYPLHTRRKYSLIIFIFTIIQSVQCDIEVSPKDLFIKLYDKVEASIQVTNFSLSNVKLSFIVEHDDIVKIHPDSIILEPKDNTYQIFAEATNAGHTVVTANATNNFNVDDIYLRVTVYKSKFLDTFSIVIGWIYFAAWSVSFYPQIYINYKRQSVIGLNFDFLVLNVIGFTLYSIFNIGLYSIPEIEAEYFNRYPRGLNPVKVNDIVFAVHATVATILTIIQCFIYERGDQRVSITARGIIGIFGVFLFISLILSATNVIHWLDFLYFCSYVKLTITLIKYMPQAYMNYQRKSTVGWSIGNILLDFTGGTLSMLQMILNSHNYNDWVSIFGDPTKFGLGLFSVVFDIFFIIQHYVLYRHTNYEENYDP